MSLSVNASSKSGIGCPPTSATAYGTVRACKALATSGAASTSMLPSSQVPPSSLLSLSKIARVSSESGARVVQQRRMTGFVIDSSTKSEAKFSLVTTLPTAIAGDDGAGFPSELKSKA